MYSYTQREEKEEERESLLANHEINFEYSVMLFQVAVFCTLFVFIGVEVVLRKTFSGSESEFEGFGELLVF